MEKLGQTIVLVDALNSFFCISSPLLSYSMTVLPDLLILTQDPTYLSSS